MLIHARSFLWAAAILWAAAWPVAAAEDRYVAWLADGTKFTAASLSSWPIPGAPYRFENHELAASNPLRFVRDRRARVSLKAPFMVLANGDVVNGVPVQLEPDLGRVGYVPRVRVQLEPPLLPVTGSGVAVRTDRIQRIVMAAEATLDAPPPGTVILADGRRLVARSIRWKEYGLTILTQEGIVEALFGDLLDVVFPRVDVAAAVLDDNLWASGTSAAAVARFQTTGGSIVTASRVSREQEQSRRRGRLVSAVYYYVQPAWADQPLAVPEQELAWCGYRTANEAPLTLLAAETLANRRLIGPPRAWLANRSSDGEALGGGGIESDLGIAAHAHSEIAFELPAGASKLALTVGLDRAVGSGGCVRCKVLAEQTGGQVLWDSGVIQGSDGLKVTGPLEVAKLKRVVLVAEFADTDRPAGADPLDIRDQVVWLAPLVTLAKEQSAPASRAAAILPGVDDWQITGKSWHEVQLASRWNLITSSWDSVLVLPSRSELRLARKFAVTSAADVVELVTSCPADVADHDFVLTVNGTPVSWMNNTDRNQLRQWVQRYGRSRVRDEDDEGRLTDRLAYWWDLSPWRGKEVSLELVLKGDSTKSEIAWRGLAIRSAVGNLPESGRPLRCDVALTSLEPVQGMSRGRALKDALPQTRTSEPIRFLGQVFTGGYGLARNSSVSFRLAPVYTQFVAVVGCSTQTAGPVRVLIDNRVVWEQAVIGSLSPAEQIEIPVPAGCRTLSLENGDGPNYGFAAFAEAGFVKAK